MIRRVAESLAPVADRLVVNAQQSQQAQFDTALRNVESPIQFAIDPVPDCGPVSGLETALESITDERGVVLACDLPVIETATLSALCTRLDEAASERTSGSRSASDCVLPRIDGQLQPLCGAYHLPSLVTAIEELDTTRNRPLRAVLDKLVVTAVEPDHVPGGPHTFENVNTRDDLETIQDALRSDG